MLFEFLTTFLISQRPNYLISVYCISNGDETAQCRITDSTDKLQCVLASASIFECTSNDSRGRYQCIAVQSTIFQQGYLSCQFNDSKDFGSTFDDSFNQEYTD